MNWIGLVRVARVERDYPVHESFHLVADRTPRYTNYLPPLRRPPPQPQPLPPAPPPDEASYYGGTCPFYPPSSLSSSVDEGAI